jgi:photosynthetic reaction center H subunit
MGTGAITQYFDAAQVTLYAFWIFFAGLVFYLRTEDKREGYPLLTEAPGITKDGFPPVPSPKTFLLRDGTSVQAPRTDRKEPDFKATPLGVWTGLPSEPIGNPLLSASGPDHAFDKESPNPIGFEVVGFDGIVGGTVSDVWVDREESLIRYYEVKTTAGTTALLPSALVRVNETASQVLLASVTGKQVGEAPTLASPDQVTWLEEDKIQAYFASGQLFAIPSRRESLI